MFNKKTLDKLLITILKALKSFLNPMIISVFIGMALLIFIVTAFKIYRVMHINPAKIIKKE